MVKWILLALGILIIVRAIKKGIRQKSWFNARGKAVERKEFSFSDFLLALFLLDMLFSDSSQQNDDWNEKDNEDDDFFEPCSIYDLDCDAIPDMFESD